MDRYLKTHLLLRKIIVYLGEFKTYRINIKMYLGFKNIHKNGWPKTNYQVFFHQGWAYLGPSENYNLGSATMVNHMQVLWQLHWMRTLYKRGKKAERTVGNTVSLVFHWLSLAGTEEDSSSCWPLLSLQGMRASSSGLFTLFNWSFCLLIFHRFSSYNAFFPLSAKRDISWM